MANLVLPRRDGGSDAGIAGGLWLIYLRLQTQHLYLGGRQSFTGGVFTGIWLLHLAVLAHDALAQIRRPPPRQNQRHLPLPRKLGHVFGRCHRRQHRTVPVGTGIGRWLGHVVNPDDNQKQAACKHLQAACF